MSVVRLPDSGVARMDGRSANASSQAARRGWLSRKPGSSRNSSQLRAVATAMWPTWIGALEIQLVFEPVVAGVKLCDMSRLGEVGNDSASGLLTVSQRTAMPASAEPCAHCLDPKGVPARLPCFGNELATCR